MWMKRKACAGGVPRSAGPMNSTALVIAPDVVLIVRSATVPLETGLVSRREPPVADSFQRMPTICWVPTCTTARSLFGTLTRGARTESRGCLVISCIAQAFHSAGFRSNYERRQRTSFLTVVLSDYFRVQPQYFKDIAIPSDQGPMNHRFGRDRKFGMLCQCKFGRHKTQVVTVYALA
jgi:hypothetical protein